MAVTGAGGFLGGYVCRALADRGHPTIGMTRRNSDRPLPDIMHDGVELRPADVLDSETLEAVLGAADVVVHCAARVSIGHENEAQTRAVNLNGTRNMLEACRKLGIQRLVHVSSVHAYTRLRGAQLDRNSPLSIDAGLPYSASKAAAHREILSAMERGEIGGSIVCPSGIIGPGDSRPSPVGRMLLDIASKRLPLLINEGYWWCDVRDVAQAVAVAATATLDSPVHFTPGRYAKFSSLARICSETLGRDVSRPSVPYWMAAAGLPPIAAYAAVRRLSPLYTRSHLKLARDCPDSVDDESARNDLGYCARPLEESVRDALTWFRANGALA